MTERVAITGLGAVSSLGAGAATLLDRWCAGEVGIADGIAACTDFVPEEVLTVKERRRADRFTQLALVSAREAMSQAGWEGGLPCDGERIGCIIGTGVGGIGTIESQHDVLRERGSAALSPLGIPMMMPNSASGVVAMHHGLKGECYGTVSACAAGAHAVGTGMRLIRLGVVDACLVGGSEAGITPLAHGCFESMGATSESGLCCPFDRRRDGFILGEGAGALVLESERLATGRGAEILGWVAGYAATADAYHLTAPDPEGAGSSRAIRQAITDAGWEIGDVDYVNAHGTSTPLNDRSETVALKLALGEHAHKVPISSTKSAIGHLLGAAGAIEAVATTAAMRERVLPPTLNYKEPDPELDLDYIGDGPRKIETNGRPPRAISNAFGFGGHNAVLCIEGSA